MIGVLIVTHGALADELLAAARVIAGELANFRALPLDWDVGLEEARAQIEQGIRSVERGGGVLVLTDMFGDTPSNAAFGLSDPGRVEVVSGVNLPMVVRLGCARDPELSLSELARAVELRGRRSIFRAVPPLLGKPEDGGGD